MASQIQERTLSQAGGELGADHVTTEQNQTNPQLETPVIGFECPRKYDWIQYNAAQHATRFIPRRVQEVAGTTGDDTLVALDNDIIPVAGETELSEQEFPVVRAADDAGNEIDITNVDYAANEVTLGQDPADGVSYFVYPVVSEGTINIRGKNQFDQNEGHLEEWGTPLYRFSDFPQLKRGTEVNLAGRAQWSENERLEFVIDSQWTVQWTHANYPDAYVSEFEQDVNIKL